MVEIENVPPVQRASVIKICLELGYLARETKSVYLVRDTVPSDNCFYWSDDIPEKYVSNGNKI